jgi:hypothetical protein
MYDVDNTGPMPTDLAERTEFRDVVVSIPALVEAASISGNPIEGRRFIDCVLLGPAILAMSEQTRLINCQFGAVEGDERNLFVKPAGERVIGAVSIHGCHIEGCLLNGLGLLGDDGFIDAFLATLTPDANRKPA